ncbi:CNH domain-containing protein [Phycomyces nitens]|nr:CNH domain-containing protein [Phycomyces nitens]
MSVQQDPPPPRIPPHGHDISYTASEKLAYLDSALSERMAGNPSAPWIQSSHPSPPPLSPHRNNAPLTSLQPAGWEKFTKEYGYPTRAVSNTITPPTHFTRETNFGRRNHDSTTETNAILASSFESKSRYTESRHDIPSRPLDASSTAIQEPRNITVSRSVEQANIRQDKILFSLEDVQAQRSRSFAYGTQSSVNRGHSRNLKQRLPLVYPALLSRVAQELRHRVILRDRIKNNVEYKNAFEGEEAIDKIAMIIRTTDRWVALRLGRALGAQRFFHDVNYESRLVDSTNEIYQFDYRVGHYGVSESPMASPGTLTTSSSSASDFFNENASVATSLLELTDQNDGLPNGVFTELTHCYSSTCRGSQPCYSYTCPKRTVMRKSVEYAGMSLTRSNSNPFIRQQSHELWADIVDEEVRLSVSSAERKRQEHIYELIYTEADFVKDLEYLEEMWIKPLRTTDIIPILGRDAFIQKVFCNILSIRDINAQLVEAFSARQKEHPIISQIGDLILEFMVDFEPFIKYGARQHEAKFELEHERAVNPEFEEFSEAKGHPDRVDIPKAIDYIKQLLTRVNTEAGKAKNRFDLERIHNNLSFKHKTDEMDLHLLEDGRYIVKQSTLRKGVHLDSTEYQVILFDHYFVVAKVKIVQGIEHYVVQKRPISVHFLSASPPEGNRTKRSSSIIPYIPGGPYSGLTPSLQMIRLSSEMATSNMPHNHTLNSGLIPPSTGSFTLYASSMATRKPWIEKILKQQHEKNQVHPVVEVVPAIPEREFYVDVKINHMVTFNSGQQYLLATDSGVYVGHTSRSKTPHKILTLDKVTQIEALETAQVLLVLSDKILWEYGLDVVNGKPETQPLGRKVQTHVPFFHVGTSLNRKLVCVPRVSTLKSTISIFEPANSPELKKPGILDRIVRTQLSSDLHLKRFKDCYIPAEALSIELSPSKMLITCPRGLIMVDMRTDKVQHLLNPGDKHLKFITEREREEANLQLRQQMIRIVVFPVPLGDYFLCYDVYGFYIDAKGNRTRRDFIIEWEGHPQSFAFSYPHVIAFDPSFIEIRNVETGELEQVIKGDNIRCLSNGHKTELPLIFGVMTDPQKDIYQTIFNLKLLPDRPPKSSQ